MKKILSIIAITATCFVTAACTPSEQRTAGYGVGGAALGALAGEALGGNSKAASTGAVLGALGGGYLGTTAVNNDRRDPYYYDEPRRSSVRYCRYRDAAGHIYSAPCRR